MSVSDERTRKDFIPAAGVDWLLPLYDPFERLVRGEREKKLLIAQAELPKSVRVLDVGCGTGTLALLIKQMHPDATVTGVDPDPKALSRARAKAARAGVDVTFEQGYAQDIDHPDDSFDVAFSSMMLHHLSRDVKRATFAEVRRLLRPGGHFHAMDFGPPKSGASAVAAAFLRRHASTADNIDGMLPELMREAGLGAVRQTGSQHKFYGSLAYYSAAA